MVTIRFRYTEGLLSPDGQWGLQRHGLAHDVEMPGDQVSHLSVQGAERRFVAWFAAERTQSRLIRWESGPVEGPGIYSLYECRLPADDP